MKIVLIHFHYDSSASFGNGRSHVLASEWSKLGHEVVILCGQLNDHPQKILDSELLYEVESLNVRYDHMMPFWRRSFSFFLFFWKSFVFLMKGSPVDLVYSSSTPLAVGLVALINKRLRKVPYFFEVRDLWPDVPIQLSIGNIGFSLLKNVFIQNIILHIEKSIYNQANKIIALSEGIASHIIFKNIDPSKIIISHNGTDSDFFDDAYGTKYIKRQEFNLAQEDFILVYAGTIGIANGCESIVEVARIFQEKRNEQIVFYFIGGGNRKSDVMKLADTYKLKNCIFLDLIPQEDLRNYLLIADLGLVTFANFPVLETNSANKFYDYLAAGLPVCINYEGWQKNYLDLYSVGVASEMGNMDLFFNNIQFLKENKELRQSMAKNGKILVRTFFERKKLAQLIEKYF